MPTMEFWGAEAKPGEPVRVTLTGGKALHLSQACMGEVPKDKSKESVYLHVMIDGRKLVLGTLSLGKMPQLAFDLVFERDMELSHTWKDGSVFFTGYRAENPVTESEDESDDESESDSESDEDIQVLAPDNGVPPGHVKQEKPAEAKKSNVKDSASGKKKVEITEANKDVTSEDDDSSDEDDDMSEDDSEDDKGKKAVSFLQGREDSTDEEDDDESSEDEEMPVQVPQPSKKRAAEPASKTPASDKKAKLVTPKKTDGKKGSVHVATPYPSKQTGKGPADKPKQQTPKTEGTHSCKPCSRTFKSEAALDNHNKAKHSDGM